MLQVFSATWCSACKQVKKFLDDNAITYTERDLDKDPTAYATLKQLGVSSIPVVYIDNDNYVIGNDADKIIKLSKLV